MTKKAAMIYANNSGNRDLGFIVNVFSTCGQSAKRIKKVVALHREGYEISTVQFVMPYDAIRIDGKAVKLDEFDRL